MGFSSVYRTLQEIFPQVDARLLRAVAIEHPKDADLAAGIVLTEVIPLVSKCKTPPATPTQDMGPGVPINVQVESEEEGNRLRHGRHVDVEDVGSSSAPQSISVEIVKTADCSSGPDLSVALDELTLSNVSNSNDGADKVLGMNEIKDLNVFWDAEDNFTGKMSNKIAKDISNGIRQDANKNLDQGQVHVDVDSENLISSGVCQETEAKLNYHIMEADSSDNNINTSASHLNMAVDSENLISSGVCQETEPKLNYHVKEADSSDNNNNTSASHLNEEWVDSVGHSADDSDANICDKNHSLEKCETPLIEVEDSETQAVCHVQGDAANAKDSDSDPSIAVGKNLESDSTFCKQDLFVSEASSVEDEIDEDNAVSQCSQTCRIDLLEEIIDEAKSNKRTLFSSMESLMNLMREVELQEKAAEQAKMEAARGGSDILVRVEEYKTMLAHAKEANDMHAGEIYGEKAILATELRELQSRLLGLSEERDKSLAILDKMRQILEARLAAAEELRKAAEHEKLEKEESARKALAEQEAMMEKVVQESSRLQLEAEENSKLREFLMDRGRVVDVLQGEISVICQDISLLKEKFDANLPLSKSFTSRETSCILASSGSSHKTSASDAGSDHSDSSELLKTSPAASIASLSSKNGHEEEERSKADDHKALLDEGWDIFEKDAELHH